MRIMHIALGGCLTAPPVAYGLTEDTGGHIGYVLGAAEAQARLPGVAVEIVTRRFDEPRLGAAHARSLETVGPGVTIRRLATARTGYLAKDDLAAELPSFTAALLAHLEASVPPWVIHAHFADAAEAALAARERFGCPVVYTPHSLALDKGRPRGGSAWATRIARESRAIARCDAVIASSRDEAERQIAAHDGVRPGRIHTIPPGVEPLPRAPDTASAQRLLEPFLREPGRPLILAIARPVRKKNLPGLVEIYAATPGLREAADLVVVAGLRDGVEDGPEEQVEVHRALLAAVDRHDLWGRVALPKRHAPADVAGLYALAAERRGVFVNPALSEPFGLTLLEAARAGLPVVATDRGGPRDILARLGHGVAVDPEDREAFGAAILRMLTEPEVWNFAHLCAEARRHLLDWRHYAARSTDVYRSLRAPRPVPCGARGMLCSDIDGTLTGTRPAARRFAAWALRRDRPFVVATGRTVTEARSVLSDWGLPEPCAWITSTGSEIYLRGADGQPEADPAWIAHISHGWAPDRVVDALAGLQGVRPQRAIERRSHKLGYVVDDPGRAAEVREALAGRGLAAFVVFSHGDLLDVVPARAGKGAAMAWVAQRLEAAPGRVLAVGDSGNDLDMLAMADLGVIVGASSELSALDGRPRVRRARAAHADGVLEAIALLDAATMAEAS